MMIAELLVSSSTNKKRGEERERELMSAAFDAHPLLLLFCLSATLASPQRGFLKV
jgi:hypothetical protein